MEELFWGVAVEFVLFCNVFIELIYKVVVVLRLLRKFAYVFECHAKVTHISIAFFFQTITQSIVSFL